MKTQNKISLKRRLLIISLLHLTLVFGILWANSFLSIQESIERSFQERLILADVVGKHVEHILRENMALLSQFTFHKGVDLTDQRWEEERAMLKNTYLASIFSYGLFLQTKNGKIVLVEPSSFPVRMLENLQLPQDRAQISNALSIGNTGRMALLATIPVHDKNGEYFGLLGGAIDPTHRKFQNVIEFSKFGKTGYVELIDEYGLVLASTRKDHTFGKSDHKNYFFDLILQKKRAIGTCHSCHKTQELQEDRQYKEKEVIAFVPLATASWGIVVRQEEHEALEPPNKMQYRFFSFAVLLLVIGLVLAWGTAQSVIHPLGILKHHALQIAHGNFSQTIPMMGQDEIGTLAANLEIMRQRLKASWEQNLKWSQELEQKIAVRTQELQTKQEMISSLLEKIISAQENERTRIARELHDETLQNLTALSLLLDTLQMGTGSTDRPGSIKMAKTKELVDRTVAEIHRIILDLRPSILDDLGLIPAIEWLAEHYLEKVGIQVVLELCTNHERLAPEIEITLFRVIQEAISNIYRHAEAKNVRIKLAYEKSLIVIEIEDDGKGFDITKEGLGLAGMRERISLLGGQMTIRASQNAGTFIVIEVTKHVTQNQGFDCR